MLPETQKLEREIQQLVDRIPTIHREYMAKLVGIAVDELVFHSPVLTGAYRASHAVGTGTASGVPTSVVYESPDHPEADRELVLGAQPILTPPMGFEARAAVLAEAPFQSYLLFNDRFYADRVEFGWPTRAGYGVYHAAETITEQAAQLVAQLPLDWEKFGGKLL